MELKHLETFIAVARLASFHRAAEELHFAQSTVSVQIAALEEDLGVRLFDRLGRRIVLTRAGELLRDHAGRLLEMARAAREEVSGLTEPGGSLTIRVPESLAVHHLPPVLARFHQRFPKVGLNLVSCAQESLERDLTKGLVDLAFLLTDSLTSAGLKAEVLLIEELVLVAAPDHPLSARGSVKTGDLAGQTLLLSRTDCSYRRQLETLLKEEGLRPGSILEFNSVAALTASVREGLGLSLLPRTAALAEADLGDLKLLPWSDGGLEAAGMMIWHQHKWLSPALTGFIQTTREVLKERDY